MMDGVAGGWGWWHGFGLISMLLFWGLVIAAVVFLVRAIAGERTSGPVGGKDRSLEILEERYARGEINKEEFEEKRRTLKL